MGRKRVSAETSTAVPAKAAVGGDGKGQAGPGQGPGGKRGDKKQAVRDALAKGIESPKAIAEHLRREQGLEITPAHVSTLKGNLKREGGTGLAERHGGERPEQEEAPAGQAARAAETPEGAPADAAGLTPRDLGLQAEIA